MRHLKLLIIIAITLIGFRGFGQINAENEIISSLIKYGIKSLPNDTIFTRKGAIKKIITLQDLDIILVNETESFLFDPKVDSLGMFKTNGLPSIDLDCYLNFKENNRSKIQIDYILDFKGTIQYISRKEIEDIFKHGGWNNYHKTFGFKALVKVSRPGLNNDKSKAFIYYSSSIDGLAGAGFYLILEKVDGKWIIKESMVDWIS